MSENDKHISDSKLRGLWQSVDVDSRPLTSSDLYRILKRNNLIMKLRRRAFCLFILGMTGGLWMLIIPKLMPVSLLLKVVYTSFLTIAGLGSLYWWYRLGKVYDYLCIPVREAQRKMAQLEKLRRKIKVYSWIVGAPVIGLLFYEIAQNGFEGSMYGALVGLIIGGSIGLWLEHLNRKQIRDVSKTFEEYDEKQL